MFNVLKRYTFNQYLAGFSIILFLLSSMTSIKRNYDEIRVLRDVLYDMLAIAFCVVSIIKGNRPHWSVGNKVLSFLLIGLGIIEVLSMKNGDASIWLMVPLFYVFAAFTFSDKLKSNIVTILLGVATFSGSSLLLLMEFHYYDMLSFRVAFLWKGIFFILLILLLVYEFSIKKSTIEQSHELSISNQLKELSELLMEEYITKEEFEVMKNSIINIHKL